MLLALILLCSNDGEQCGGAVEAELSLRVVDKELEVRVFTDHTVMEVFFADGRVALTLPLPPAARDAGFALFSGAAEGTVGARTSLPAAHVGVAFPL